MKMGLNVERLTELLGKKPPTIQVYRIEPNSTMQNIVSLMRTAARVSYLQHEPQGTYSKTVDEANERAKQALPEVLRDCATKFLTFTDYPGQIVSLVVSMEDGTIGPVWHLSMGVAGDKEPERVPDALADRLARLFGTLDEGPSEGVFKNVRHFRGPWFGA